ncbi:helix-turn-helix transcriptional regulator [Pseudomonas helleri]|uniref:AlpA family phage regulatory protein n=2 Tax=Pseudomonas helleri TaxID=1608996 RepID=A0A7X1YD19_9PSED|nr:AlpA family transcriptional regulator [Pseudomonas helleri]MQT97845.1 AlpA family phage regulatory protein [Pseudomonas helleri]MQU33703.1 AlpA family phage regulatory protein [Pseudomonas helleri]
MHSPPNLAEQSIAQNALIALPEVMMITGLKTTKIYEMVKQGIFPKKVRIGPRAVRWVRAEVLSWVDEQIAARR